MTGRRVAAGLAAGLALAFACPAARAADPPDWMRAAAALPTPEHDAKALAYVMHSDYVLTVQPDKRLIRTERMAIRILRPGGESYGIVRRYFDAQTRITAMHGWSIPPVGKYFEGKERDLIESDLAGISNGELVSDLHSKILRIPSSSVGSLIGYEVESEIHPQVLNDEWDFQEEVPVRASSYTLRLPPGWSYKTTWINREAVEPVASGRDTWTWSVGESQRIYDEDFMPPWRGIAARMVVSLEPPAGQDRGWSTWAEMGTWYTGLTRGRRDATREIQQKAAELTAAETTALDKMRALARFVQTDIRYVAIELGIGGYQPHAASEVFGHRYGDCKDKVTLLAAMLQSVGIDSYYFVINTVRGTVSADTPPNNDFDHMVLAVALPKDVSDPTLVATVTDPALGRLLIFDPTDDLTPFGSLSGPLQANYGLLVAPDGGRLVLTPQLPPDANSLTRVATLKLGADGTLSGDVREVWTGDRANQQRSQLRSVSAETDRIKPIETLLAHSLTKFFISKAAVINAGTTASAKPFEWRYSIEAADYSKSVASLVMVRPRVFDEKGSGFLENKEPRHYAIEITSPLKDTDTFEIALPDGYEVDELPPPVKAEYDFGSYHSKSEVVGRTLRYTRTLEIRRISIPAAQAESLKEFFRKVFGDERQTAVLKRIGT